MEEIFKKLCKIFNSNANEEHICDISKKNLDAFLWVITSIAQSNNTEVLKKYIKFLANGIQAKLNFYSYKYDTLLKEKDLQSNIIECLIPNHQKLMQININKEYNINETPIISCIWDNRRIYNNLIGIGQDIKSVTGDSNPFDYKIFSDYGGECTIVKPLGLIIVTQHNHSINSAIIKNEGRILVKKQYDLEKIFYKYNFDGVNYIPNNLEEHSSNKNKSLFIPELGYMYEIGRILYENKIDFS